MHTPKQPTPTFDPDAFRDSIATIRDDGKRQWIYPKKPTGAYHNSRLWTSAIFLALLFMGPFLRWHGEPLFMLNIIARKFILFGITFTPQDFYLLALALITFFVFIILFTVVFGRIFCGWLCPQTIFMEMVFRKIEYWIEGDAHRQYKLNQQPWNPEKILKKSAKSALFALIAFAIGNLIMAYLIGSDQALQYITHSPTQHWPVFTGVLAFSGIFYFVFAWFREQACIIVCPYGRLQSVLVNRDTMAIMYDFKRGEPRGKIQKNQPTRTHGDCIDCKQCVHVCPTGIDIRNGIQLECVACTACIDACDEVMDKVGFERGLIRYASHNSVEEQKPFKIQPRVWAYSGLLAILISTFAYLLATRGDLSATLLRSPGMTFQTLPSGEISNLYTLQITSKINRPQRLHLRLLTPQAGTLQLIGGALTLAPYEVKNASVLVRLPRQALTGLKTTLDIGLFRGDTLLQRSTTSFLGPL